MMSKTDEYFPRCFVTHLATLLLLLVMPFSWCPRLAVCSLVIVWCNCFRGPCTASHRGCSLFSFFHSFLWFSLTLHQLLTFSCGTFQGVLSISTIGISSPSPHPSRPKVLHSTYILRAQSVSSFILRQASFQNIPFIVLFNYSRIYSSSVNHATSSFSSVWVCDIN